MLNQFGDLVFRNSISAFEIALTKHKYVGTWNYIWEKLIDFLANQANSEQDGGQWVPRVVCGSNGHSTVKSLHQIWLHLP